MGLITRKRLGGDDQTGGQEDIDQERAGEKHREQPPRIRVFRRRRDGRDRPGDEDPEKIDRAQDGHPGQDGTDIPQEYHELEEDEAEKNERREAGDKRARDPGARAPALPSQGTRAKGHGHAEDDGRCDREEHKGNGAAVDIDPRPGVPGRGESFGRE